MKIDWTARALTDLDRLTAFLAPVNLDAAIGILRLLQGATESLIEFPRMYERVDGYEPREIRRVIVDGRYELRYEIVGETIVVLRVFHVREDR
jgi:plasmid stabilization system protein ParE